MMLSYKITTHVFSIEGKSIPRHFSLQSFWLTKALDYIITKIVCNYNLQTI